MFPSSPWWREITTSGVQRFGRMPRSSNSIGRSSGSASVSAMYAFTPSTYAGMIVEPRSW